LSFKFLDLMADGCGGHGKVFGCPGEAQMLRRGVKSAKRPEAGEEFKHGEIGQSSKFI
jgi:hypothetical protein